MKKITLILIVATAIFNLSFQDTQEHAAKKFKQKCMVELTKRVADLDDAHKLLMEEYCSCMGVNITAHFQNESLTQLMEDMDNSDKKDEVFKTIGPYIQPCMDELKKKLAALDAKKLETDTEEK